MSLNPGRIELGVHVLLSYLVLEPKIWFSLWWSEWIKGNGSWSDSVTTFVQQTLPFPWQGRRQCSLQLLIQPWICAPGTHYGWVDQGGVNTKFAWRLYTWPALGIKPQTLWYWVQCPIHLATCSQWIFICRHCQILMNVLWGCSDKEIKDSRVIVLKVSVSHTQSINISIKMTWFPHDGADECSYVVYIR